MVRAAAALTVITLIALLFGITHTATPETPILTVGAPVNPNLAYQAADEAINTKLVNDYLQVLNTTTTTTAAKPIRKTVTAKPAAPRRVVAASTAGAVPCDGNSDDCIWTRIAQCETHNNWQTNTGNGYMGGLQMDMTFWRSYGGLSFAPRPDLASRGDQITVARRARDSGRGYTPWPVCGRFIR